MMIFLGLYLANVIGTKVFPNEPVPPVISIVFFCNTLGFFLKSYWDFSFKSKQQKDSASQKLWVNPCESRQKD